MNITSIGQAIEAHMNWLTRFRAVTSGYSDESFDVSKVRDDTACALGAWLVSDSSVKVIGQDAHHMIKTMHGTFHEVAYLVSLMLNSGESKEEAADLIRDLDHLSVQLVHLLKRAQQKL